MSPGSISGLAFVGVIVSCRKLAGIVDEPRGAWLGWDLMVEARAKMQHTPPPCSEVTGGNLPVIMKF